MKNWGCCGKCRHEVAESELLCYNEKEKEGDVLKRIFVRLWLGTCIICDLIDITLIVRPDIWEKVDVVGADGRFLLSIVVLILNGIAERVLKNYLRSISSYIHADWYDGMDYVNGVHLLILGFVPLILFVKMVLNV